MLLLLLLRLLLQLQVGASGAGVISIGDVVKYRMDVLQHEAEALTDMIKGY